MDRSDRQRTMPDSRDQLRTWVLQTIRRIIWDGQDLEITLTMV